MKLQDALKERSNNFTLLRLLAALAVLFGHSYDLTLGKPGGDPVTRYLIYPLWGDSLPGIAVALFFVTSGFLVTASYIRRQSLIEFIVARVLRIYPGLIIAVLLTALVVGPLVTTAQGGDYWLSQTTWSYIKNNALLVTGVQYNLPFVFVDNPFPISVNGSLWTLPIELRMYFWVAVLGSMTLLRSEKAFNALVLVLCLLYAQSDSNFFLLEGATNAHFGLLFLLGGFFYVNRQRIPLGVIGILMLCVAIYITSTYHISEFVKSVSLAYLVLLLALHPKIRLPSIDNFGDLSYGLYIYAFPVQQTVVYLVPQIRALDLFLLSTMITIILSIVSWRLIERPALKLKGKVMQFKYEDLLANIGFKQWL